MYSLLCNFVFIVLFSFWALGADDCKLSCEIEGKKYLSSACKKNCNKTLQCQGGKIRSVPMTDEMRRFIQDYHNYLRSKIAGKPKRGDEKYMLGGTASNMETMNYNMELEHAAQCNWEIKSHHCKFQHDKCRITAKYKSVGQNIGDTFAGFEDKTMVERVMDEWRSQMEYFIESPDQSGAQPEIKQILNAETNQIGCGIFLDIVQLNLVCNYAPAFLEHQTKLFKNGPPCSDCPATTHCEDGGEYANILCAENLDSTTSTTSNYHSQENIANIEEQTSSTYITSIYGNETGGITRPFKRNRNGATETKASVVLMNFSLAIVCSMKALFVMRVHL